MPANGINSSKRENFFGNDQKQLTAFELDMAATTRTKEEEETVAVCAYECVCAYKESSGANINRNEFGRQGVKRAISANL